MKIAIASVQVPFIRGGAEILLEQLKSELIKREYDVDCVTLPFKWYPLETLYNCMLSGRMLDLCEVNSEKIDLVIALKFPAYYLHHPRKILWLLHQHRQAYDLWNTPFGDLHHDTRGEYFRNLIRESDSKYLSECVARYTISKNVSNRLLHFNGLGSKPIYHPPLNYDKLFYQEIGDFIFYPSRIDPIKRQRLLIEAAQYLKSPVKIVISGTGSHSEFEYLRELVIKLNLSDRVTLLGYIDEDKKIDLYSRCLGVYFGAIDEDYGYVTLESFFAAKPVVVHPDAGGPLEFVLNEENGLVVDASAVALAQSLDDLFFDKERARKMGLSARQYIADKNVSWDYVIKQLLLMD